MFKLGGSLKKFKNLAVMTCRQVGNTAGNETSATVEYFAQNNSCMGQSHFEQVLVRTKKTTCKALAALPSPSHSSR